MTRSVSDTGCHAHPYATQTESGLVQLSTDTEAIAGIDTDAALTPANLAAWAAANPSTDAARGLVELATDAEVIAGTDTERAVTPASLDAWAEAYPALNPATETSLGVVELATAAEAAANPATNEALAVTPYTLGQYSGQIPAATSFADDDLVIVRDVSQGRDVSVTIGELRDSMNEIVEVGSESAAGSGTQVLVTAAENVNGIIVTTMSGSTGSSAGSTAAFFDDSKRIFSITGDYMGASTTGPIKIPAGHEFSTQGNHWAATWTLL